MYNKKPLQMQSKTEDVFETLIQRRILNFL